MPTTRRQAREKEDELRRVKAESLRQERAKRRHSGPPPVVTIDSADAEVEHAGAKRRRRTEGDAAGSSGFQLQPQTSAPVGEVPLVPVKQEVDVLPRRKKKRVDRAAIALAAATARMAEMERRLGVLEQANADLRRQNDEQAAEIARLRGRTARTDRSTAADGESTTAALEENWAEQSAECERPAEANAETRGHVFYSFLSSHGIIAFSQLSVPPNDQPNGVKKKRKLKDDARRALLQHVFGADQDAWEQDGDAPPPPEHVLTRLTRRQTARFFFCCRSFSAIFFRPSERYGKSVEQELRVRLSDAWCNLSPASGVFRFDLSSERMSRQSLFSFLRLGQAKVRRLVLEIYTTTSSLRSDPSSWAQVLPALHDLRELTKFDVEIDLKGGGERQSTEIIDALLESLPDPITSFCSSNLEDFRLLAPEIRRALVGTARIGRVVDQTTSFGHFLRSNARVLNVSNADYMKNLAAFGSCKSNPAVERVLLRAEIGCKSAEWAASMFRSAFANLRPLNDHFTPFERFNNRLMLVLSRGCQLLELSKETGIPSLELVAGVRLPNPITAPTEYKELWSRARQLFAKRPEFQKHARDGDLVEKYANHRLHTLLSVWTCVSTGAKFRFVFYFDDAL
ncbi:hypothetical protein M3Y99_00245700 [Aphelenchoides fujianensis]|nr:hypothetical protein M3Y99_00245700 [Aphelenchoides fujianensis]